jgi:hypothetical protein
MREWILWALAALSVDGAVVDTEPVLAQAAVVAAYATLSPEVKPEPTPEPQPEPEGCCGECNGTGSVRMPDGHVVPCPCPESCECKTNNLDCPDGKCPTPKTTNRRR